MEIPNSNTINAHANKGIVIKKKLTSNDGIIPERIYVKQASLTSPTLKFGPSKISKLSTITIKSNIQIELNELKEKNILLENTIEIRNKGFIARLAKEKAYIEDLDRINKNAREENAKLKFIHNSYIKTVAKRNETISQLQNGPPAQLQIDFDLEFLQNQNQTMGSEIFDLRQREFDMKVQQEHIKLQHDLLAKKIVELEQQSKEKALNEIRQTEIIHSQYKSIDHLQSLVHELESEVAANYSKSGNVSEV